MAKGNGKGRRKAKRKCCAPAEPKPCVGCADPPKPVNQWSDLPMSSAPKCRHCRKRTLGTRRRRGLCWACYSHRRIRKLYPVGGGGRACLTGRDLPPEVEVLAPPSGQPPGEPGSERRVQELARRYDQRMALWPGRVGDWADVPVGQVLRLFAGHGASGAS